MINYAKTLFATILLAFTIGCAGIETAPIDTKEDYLTRALIEFQEVVKTALRWQKEGRLDSNEEVMVAELFDRYLEAHKAAVVAVRLKQDAEYQHNTQVMLTALLALRGMLTDE
jgi:hypothetical protein